MSRNHYVWHRASHVGPRWYSRLLAPVAAIGCIAMGFGLSLAYLDGFWSGVLILWVMTPVIAGCHVGLSGIRAGGLPALVGFLFLLLNFVGTAALYMNGDDTGATTRMLMAPLVHLMAVVGVAALQASMGQRMR